MRPSDVILLSGMRDSCRSGAAKITRERAGVTQREIAAACGVSAQTIALWETGQRTPSGPPALEYGKLLRQLAKRAA